MAEDASEGLVFKPMEQFTVKPLFGGTEIEWYTITNVTLWMAVTVAAIAILFVIGTSRRAIIPSRLQSVAELAYGFVYKMVEDVTGHDGVRYFPYIFTLFLFIVFSNFIGLIPGSFTTTAQIAVTGVLAILVFLTVTVLGFVKNGAAFLGLFWVSSAPLPLRPVLAVIEIISYFVRPVSHSIRLAGNMPRGRQGLRGLCTPCPDVRDRRSGDPAFDPRHHRDVRARCPRGLHPGLRLHDPDLCLHARRAASASLIAGPETSRAIARTTATQTNTSKE